MSVSTDAVETPTGNELPELASEEYMAHAEAVAATGFWAVAKRLPALTRESLRLAWAASPRDTVAALSLQLAAGVMTTLGLLATGGVLASLFAEGPTPDRIYAALPSLVLAAVAVAARAGLTSAAGWAQQRLRPQINYQVESQMFEATTAVSLEAFEDSGFAQDMDRARDRGMREAAWIADSSVDLITGLVGVAAAGVAVAILAPVLLPCLVIAALPPAITQIRIARYEYLMMLKYLDRRRRAWMIAGLLANRWTAMEVRAFQMRDFLLGQYRTFMQAETRLSLQLAGREAAVGVFGRSITGLATAGVYALLAVLLTRGSVPLAAAATALFAMQAASGSLANVTYAIHRLYEDALYYSDFRRFLDRAAQRTHAADGSAVDRVDTISLRDVSFAYPGAKTDAVKEVSLELRRGQVVALVGENGSGKTTLAHVVAGLYQPTAGEIAVNGLDVASLSRQTLAGHIAVITQKYYEFPFNVRDNIHIGRHDRPVRQTEVEIAAQRAAAHDMIEGLPFGYDTLLSKEFKHGHDLSGGQWQRLVAARGMYRDATVLIADEPSAALDAKAEHAFFQQLRQQPERLVVLITHRLANVRFADVIHVMQDGRITDSGTHDELLARDGHYAELYRLQASGYTQA